MGFPVDAREGTKTRNRHTFLVNPFYIPSYPLFQKEIPTRFLHYRFRTTAALGPIVHQFFNSFSVPLRRMQMRWTKFPSSKYSMNSTGSSKYKGRFFSNKSSGHPADRTNSRSWSFRNTLSPGCTAVDMMMTIVAVTPGMHCLFLHYLFLRCRRS